MAVNPDASNINVSHFPAPTNQQETTNHNRTDTCPDRYIDTLLFIERHVYRTQIGLMGLLGIAKAAICKPQGTAYYQ